MLGVLEITKPAAQRPVEVRHDAREAVAACAFRLRPDTVLEAGQALLADQTPTGFEPITEELEAFPGVIGVGKELPSPPSEPYGRFSRIRLSSRWFPHREGLAVSQAVCSASSPA